MYKVAVRRDFIAQHWLVDGDWGVENQVHSHHYQVEVQVEGVGLNEHGFLVDIVSLGIALDDLLHRYNGKSLNEQPEFQGINPSLEHFCCILCQVLAAAISTDNLAALTITLWENQAAWASFRHEIQVS